MGAIKKWIDDHPTLWEFIKFNVLSNVATMANFVVMWVCIGFVFKSFSGQPFQFFIFNYTTSESLMLCGFLSFLAATACAQTVNFFVQKNLVFKSSADFGKAVPKFIILAVVLVYPVRRPACLQPDAVHQHRCARRRSACSGQHRKYFVQVIISYPTMKFWVMPDNK